jgi:2-polyprenyl-3-methyl-5-hydroxy-6-metoxy-1,4-benzoquinol methylase
MIVQPIEDANKRVIQSLPDADVLEEQLSGYPDGLRKIVVNPKQSSLFIPRREVVTSYPDELILLILGIKGPGYLCDEIARDEDPSFVEAALKQDILSFMPAEDFEGKRILDFGCGAGASTMILNRMLKGADIHGVELDARLLSVAKARAVHYGSDPGQLLLAPNGRTLPANLGTFDAVVLSAVWEHLLPMERPAVLKQIWSVLRPGGCLFLNQTPNRFSPIEGHTTGLPLINYLPDRLAHAAVVRFSKRTNRDTKWETLLRRGIRGGTTAEILEIIRGTCLGTPSLMSPIASSGDKDVIDLWYKSSASARLPILKRGIWASLKIVKMTTGAEILPWLTLAIRKEK